LAHDGPASAYPGGHDSEQVCPDRTSIGLKLPLGIAYSVGDDPIIGVVLHEYVVLEIVAGTCDFGFNPVVTVVGVQVVPLLVYPAGHD
jgi:hypothetical protein